jgi:hypothetical protein
MNSKKDSQKEMMPINVGISVLEEEDKLLSWAWEGMIKDSY